MKESTVLITEFDMERLQFLMRERDAFPGLRARLERAAVIPVRDTPRDTVTMHTKVLIRDLATGADQTLRVVFPWDENTRQGRISVTNPLGTALLGRRTGDVVEWELPGNRVRCKAKIITVTYQPERLGHFHL